MDTSEAELIKRISVARGNTEPDKGPTEEPEAVDVSAETPEETEEVAEVVADNTDTEADAPVDTEEEESEEAQSPTDSDDEEELYVEYKGRDLSLKDIEEWEQGHLRLSDYKRKTREHAENVRTFEAEREEGTAQHKQLAERIATLDAIIAEDTLSADALKELREYEPEEFIKYQEKIAKRKELLGAAKEVTPTNNVDVAAESNRLFEAHPEWLKDGKQTDAYTNDMKSMEEVGLSLGFTVAEMSGITAAKHFELLHLAAIGAKSLKSNASIVKKVRKAPVTTKPRAATKASLTTEIEAAQKRLQQTGRTEDAVKLRQLRRQQTG